MTRSQMPPRPFTPPPCRRAPTTADRLVDMQTSINLLVGVIERLLERQPRIEALQARLVEQATDNRRLIQKHELLLAHAARLTQELRDRPEAHR